MKKNAFVVVLYVLFTGIFIFWFSSSNLESITGNLLLISPPDPNGQPATGTPGTCTTSTWSNCKNAFADDTSRATVTVGYSTPKDVYYSGYNWGNVALNSGSRVTNVTIYPQVYSSNSYGRFNIVVSPDNGTTWSSRGYNFGGNTQEQTFALDITNAFNISWTADRLRNLVVYVECWKTASYGTNPTCRLDYLPVYINFTNFDYSVFLSSDNAITTQGGTAQVNLDVHLINGLPQDAYLDYSFCPTGAICTFSQQSGKPTFQSTFTIQTSSSTPIQNYTIWLARKNAAWPFSDPRSGAQRFTLTVRPALGAGQRISTTCSLTDTLFRTNIQGDAAQFDNQNYDLKVCYPEAGPISRACTLSDPMFSTTEFRLFLINKTNNKMYTDMGTQGQYYGNDFTKICTPTVSCYYETDPNLQCGESYQPNSNSLTPIQTLNATCLFSLSDINGGSVGDCNTYPIKGCCLIRDNYPNDACSRTVANDRCGLDSCNIDTDNDGSFNAAGTRSENRYALNINTGSGKLIYIENQDSTASPGDTLILTSNTGFTSILRYDSFDSANTEIELTDLSVNPISINFVYQNNQGTITREGASFRFTIDSNGRIVVDLNNNGIIDVFRAVDITTSNSSYSTSSLTSTPIAALQPDGRYRLQFITRSLKAYDLNLTANDILLPYEVQVPYGCDLFANDGCSILALRDNCRPGCGPDLDADNIADVCEAPSQVCNILSATWSASQAFEGQNVNLNVRTTEGCNGQTANFLVQEVDLLANDNVIRNPQTVQIVNGQATGVWAAEFQDDGIGGGDPEYVYQVSIGALSTTSTAQLIVTRASSNVCGNGRLESGETCQTCYQDAGCGNASICCLSGLTASCSSSCITNGTNNTIITPGCMTGLVNVNGTCSCRVEKDNICPKDSSCKRVDKDCDDGDDVQRDQDNCPDVKNADQADFDKDSDNCIFSDSGYNLAPDGLTFCGGDLCDYDSDNDGICDLQAPVDGYCEGQDNCPNTPANAAVDTEPGETQGCTAAQVTCLIEWDCANVAWHACDSLTGLRSRDLGDCSKLGIENGLCKCNKHPSYASDCVTNSVFIPKTLEQCEAGQPPQEFPFFDNLSLVITLLLLTGFYLARRKL